MRVNLRHLLPILLLALAACDQPRSEAYTPAESESEFKPVTAELQAAQLAREIDGIATLLSPDALTQLNAEIRAAELALGFSQRTLERFKGTTSLGEHRLDNAQRQAEVDATQLALLELKLRNTWGETAPFLVADRRQALVDELSSGKTTLVRVDFPRSVERDPKNVRITPLGGGDTMPVSTIWPAPSGSLAMPGTSFFGIMRTGPGLRPGDRAKVTAERGAPLMGVVVPSAAVIVFASDSWCYVETAAGTFERKRVSLATPVADGYLTRDFAPGTKVVVQGASALLSREAGPGSFDDDDDDDGDRPRAKRPASDDDDAPKKDAPDRSPPIASTDPD